MHALDTGSLEYQIYAPDSLKYHPASFIQKSEYTLQELISKEACWL